jgi:hypothetical protein
MFLNRLLFYKGKNDCLNLRTGYNRLKKQVSFAYFIPYFCTVYFLEKKAKIVKDDK